MIQYTYLSSITYINSLKFDYVNVYSFQRGTKFLERSYLIRKEYEKLKNRKVRHNNLTTVEEGRFLELDELFGYTQYLVNEKGHFHPSSIKTHTFAASTPEINRLKNIMRTEIKDIPAWMCAPVYRDALAFYSESGEIVSTLNICLSCQYMETNRFNHINGDAKTYNLLRQFFIDLGHAVEPG
ncbi:hypothetical protein [Desertivirga arenae]|uniref:hypothetical protein n=1 Tax=Desertivirga arenae TaxID=2810309 RepID=UPI001A9713BB|nr:hypothetical protein [Pedobacter sp. SYSU D00823]